MKTMTQHRTEALFNKIVKVSQMNKKERGVSRAVMRLLDEMVSDPSAIEGQRTIDFRLDINAYIKGVSDTFMELIIRKPKTAHPDVFQKVALSAVYSVLRANTSNYYKESLGVTTLLRFEQVKFPISKIQGVASLAKDYFVKLPVITELIPEDFEQRSAKEKLEFVLRLSNLAENYLLRRDHLLMNMLTDGYERVMDNYCVDGFHRELEKDLLGNSIPVNQAFELLESEALEPSLHVSQYRITPRMVVPDPEDMIV